MASQLAAPVTFTSGTTIVSDDVDANFAANRTAFNALLTGTDQLVGGLTANGAFTVAAGLTVTGTVTMATAISKIVPGATSWGVRNNADGADNIIITDAGAVTLRSTVGGITTLTATTLAGTLSTATQNSVTTMTGLVTTGALDSGSITSNFGNVDIGASTLTAATLAGTLSTAAQANVTSLGTLTALQVDNININGNTISSTAGTDLLITPLAGQQIVLDGAIVVDAGVVTGATSITSTTFVGALTGNADTATTVSDPLRVSDGSVTVPSYSFTDDTNTGMYRDADSGTGFDELRLIAAGANTLKIRATRGLYVGPTGSAALPSIAWDTENDTGIYLVGSNRLGFSTNGAQVMEVDANATANQTRLIIYSTVHSSMERVTIGATDSGGSGFRSLNIANA